MKLVVCTRSALEHLSFFASVVPWASAVSVLLCIGGKTLGFVGLSHRDFITDAVLITSRLLGAVSNCQIVHELAEHL